MKCSDCKYWFNSKSYGQGCNCPGVRPCDIEKNNKKKKFQRQYKKKKKERYAY